MRPQSVCVFGFVFVMHEIFCVFHIFNIAKSTFVHCFSLHTHSINTHREREGERSREREGKRETPDCGTPSTIAHCRLFLFGWHELWGRGGYLARRLARPVFPHLPIYKFPYFVQATSKHTHTQILKDTHTLWHGGGEHKYNGNA